MVDSGRSGVLSKPLPQATDSSYEVIAYQPEFKQQVLELQTQLWSPSLELNRAYFDWKYERNPYLSTPLIYLALHQGKVVGMRGFSGLRWEAGSPPQILTGLYADDMVIDRDHRKRGLMRLIMDAAFKDLALLGCEYVFNLSAGPVTFVSSLSMGWQSPGSMQPMRWRSWRLAGSTGMHRIATHFPALSRRAGRVLTAKLREDARALAATDPIQVRSRLRNNSSISFAVEPRVDDMSALVNRIGSDGRIRHVRDHCYLGWRFQNPLSRYGFLFYQKEGLEGYLVLQEYTSEFADRTALNIVDWEGTSVQALSQLLEAARQAAGHRKLLITWGASFSKDKLELLAKSGFQLIEGEPGTDCHQPALLVRSLTQDLPASEWQFAGRRLVDMAEWDLRMLYSMCG
jgi:GNAT superfamily N-acetyltransferase